MTRSVAVLAFAEISPFHLAVPSAVFANHTLSDPQPKYEVTVCCEQPGSLPTTAGYNISVPHDLTLFATADTIVIPTWNPAKHPSPQLLSAITDAHARGAQIVGLCLGAYPIALSGITRGRTVTTHWAYTDQLQHAAPHTTIEKAPLWIDHGDVITSAGVAAGLDCCIHIVREHWGASTANMLARQLVLAPHRTGSQAQYVPELVLDAASDDPIVAIQQYALTALDQPFTLDTWAARAHMSRRTFTRTFRKRTGTSPGEWFLAQRLAHAKHLLENSDHSIEHIAAQLGFATSASLRQHFQQQYNTSPREHRRQFRA